MTLDGTTALHLGDTQSDPATWRAAGMPETGAELALVPYWYALEEGLLEAAMAVLRTKRVVPSHAALEAMKSDWPETSRGLLERHPEVRAPLAPGEIAD